MKFEELTKKDIKYIKSIYDNKDISWDDRMNSIVEFIGKSERTARKWLVELGFKSRETAIPKVLEQAKQKKVDNKKKIFLITSAQNATPVNQGFLSNMESYAKHLNAEILVIPFRYHNPTSLYSKQDQDQEWWDPKIVKYLTLNRHDLNNNISVLSDVKIQPTATNPLSGLQGLTGDHSCIVGHSRVHLESLPTLDANKHKLMLTTGSLTKPNFTDSKSGKLGEFHFTYGFVIVEIKDSETFFARQVTATDKGGFCDLYYKIENEKVDNVKSVSAAIIGDIHLGCTDDKAMNATINLLDRLNPKHSIIHDLFDGASVNHHEEKNFVSQYKKEISGTNSLKKEIDYMIEWLNKMNKYNLVVTRGNHDDFVDRWIINSDLKKNVKNALEYVEYAKILLTESTQGIIPYIINKNFKNIKTLGVNDSFKVNGFELSQHGMLGASGSRGSVEGFRKLNSKMVVGHMHSPSRKDGVLVVGTLTKLRMGYNNGPSSWIHSNVIIHENKKAQHIHIINGEYTTFK